MKCTTCIEFFQSDKIGNPFISGCSNLRAPAVTDHEQSKTHMKAIVALSAKGKSTTEKMVSEAGKTLKLLKSSECLVIVEKQQIPIS
jgi:uncharacterized protein YbbK (DUF523 family)